MEKSEQGYHNESFDPPTIVLIQEQNDQADFVQPPSHSRFVDTGFQNDFNQKSNFGPPPQQRVNTTPTFMPHEPDSNDSYCGRLFRNRRQASSVLGGLLLMLNSGLHIGWGIWRSVFFGHWLPNSSFGLQIFVIMAWSMGAFIGGFAGSIATRVLRKDSIYHLSGAIMIVGNILILILDEYGEAIGSGRVLMGIAHGLAYVTLITHAGENGAKNMRGTVLSIVNCMIYTGIFVSVVITGTVQFDWNGRPESLSAERILGIVGTVLAVGAIGCNMMMAVESVPFLLRMNSQEHAKINLKQLRGLSHDTLALTQEMEEFNLMVVQDKQDNWNLFTDGNGKPLFLMILMRIMVALTNNFLLNILALAYASQMFDLYNVTQQRLVPLVVVAPRLAMSIIQIFYADALKRKIQFGVSSLLAAIILIVLGIVLNTVTVNSWAQLQTVNIAIAVLWLLFQFACSIGMDQMQDVYLSEAFSTAKKHWSIPFVAGFEHLFHIFMIGMYFVGISATAHINAIIFVSAVVVILLGVVLVLTLPETQNMTLKQAKDSFLNYSVNLAAPFS